MENERYDREDLDRAVEAIRNGGIILYPTDTVWGIGCDAANVDAVEKIYRLKRALRQQGNALPCRLRRMLQRSVRTVPDAAWQLIEAAVNPLTIIYDHPIGIAENLKADDGSLGIRITSEPFSSALCRRLRGPIVSTSANVSGKRPRDNSPTSNQRLSMVWTTRSASDVHPPEARNRAISSKSVTTE